MVPFFSYLKNIPSTFSFGKNVFLLFKTTAVATGSCCHRSANGRRGHRPRRDLRRGVAARAGGRGPHAAADGAGWSRGATGGATWSHGNSDDN